MTQYVAEVDFIHKRFNYPLIVNRHDWVAFYHMGIRGNVLRSEYLVLPQFERNIHVVVDILDLLIDLRPDLFPGMTKLDWLENDEFVPEEVKTIEAEIREEERKTRDFEKRKDKEKKKIAKELRFFRQILVADDEHFKGSDRLRFLSLGPSFLSCQG